MKWLILANVAVYLVYFFGSWIKGEPIFDSLLLMPSAVIRGAVWQLVTYLFLHSLSSFWHILFNMLTLWMFGAPIEETWGTRRFLQYYFLCGIGAAICVVIVDIAIGSPNQRTLGASGAIYGLLLAYGMLFPDQTVLFSFLFPIKAKYMVMIFGAIAFLSSFQGGSTVSNLAHLGGMIFGYLYMKTQFGSRGYKSGVYAGYGGGVSSRKSGGGFSFDLAGRWKAWQLQRARNKFKVYMKKQGSDRDNWVN
ncbi:MAG TPA: rhomboid family intramembrane serine protease [Bryobacteraceae bacterium]|nr:rhomboid family intramembrane serine protease [Bryobacteraceae bacterium]